MHCQDDRPRLYKALAVAAGFLVHLILDEVWSITFRQGRLQLKSSFGTALKFFGPSPLANLSTYAKLALLVWLVWHDHEALHREPATPMLQPWSLPTAAETWEHVEQASRIPPPVR
jgi:hypothetical protein